MSPACIQINYFQDPMLCLIWRCPDAAPLQDGLKSPILSWHLLLTPECVSTCVSTCHPRLCQHSLVVDSEAFAIQLTQLCFFLVQASCFKFAQVGSKFSIRYLTHVQRQTQCVFHIMLGQLWQVKPPIAFVPSTPHDSIHLGDMSYTIIFVQCLQQHTRVEARTHFLQLELNSYMIAYPMLIAMRLYLPHCAAETLGVAPCLPTVTRLGDCCFSMPYSLACLCSSW